MATINQHGQAHLGAAGAGATRAAAGGDGRPMAARLTSEQVWHQIAKASFAPAIVSGPGQGRRGQGARDRAQGAAGAGLAAKGGGVRGPDPA